MNYSIWIKGLGLTITGVREAWEVEAGRKGVYLFVSFETSRMVGGLMSFWVDFTVVRVDFLYFLISIIGDYELWTFLSLGVRLVYSFGWIGLIYLISFAGFSLMFWFSVGLDTLLIVPRFWASPISDCFL